MKQNAIPGGFFTFFPFKIVIIKVANIWWVPVTYLEQAHIYDVYVAIYELSNEYIVRHGDCSGGGSSRDMCEAQSVPQCATVCHSVPQCASHTATRYNSSI